MSITLAADGVSGLLIVTALTADSVTFQQSASITATHAKRELITVSASLSSSLDALVAFVENVPLLLFELLPPRLAVLSVSLMLEKYLDVLSKL